MRPRKIVIGTPMAQWTVGGAHHFGMWPLMRACLETEEPKIDIIDPRLTVDDDLVRARSRLVRIFREETDGTDLLFVDSDVEPSVRALRGMLAENVDCIGATYPKKRLNGFGRPDGYAMSTLGRDIPIEGHRARVPAIGLGFMLISRALLDVMTEDLDEELWADDMGRRTTMLFMLKFGPVEKDGRRHLWPEDYSFCSRVAQFTDVFMYTGPGAPLSHEGHHIFRGRAEDVHPRVDPDVAYEDESGQARTWGDDRP